MTTDRPSPLTHPLRACARGVHPAEAGVELLIEHGTFLRRDDFRARFVDTTLTDDTQTAEINWSKAITALNNQTLACSGGEARILRLAASIAVGIPVNLRDALTGLDTTNIERLTRAILHANGRRTLSAPSHEDPRSS